MNVFQYAGREEVAWKAMLQDMTDYKPFTTFFYDFSIAEFMSRESGVRDAYKRAFEGWKTDIKYMTELCMVLNHKIWEWHDKHGDLGNVELAYVYNELWQDCAEYIETHFEGEELAYYYRVTD